MKKSELKQLIREVVKAVSLTQKFIAFKDNGGKWTFYEFGLNPKYPDTYINVDDPNKVKGFSVADVKKYKHVFLFGDSLGAVKRQVENKEDENKLYDIDIVTGEIILSVDGSVGDDSVGLKCKSGNIYNVEVWPDDNASAEISEINLKDIIGKNIVFAEHDDKDSYGVSLIMKASDGSIGKIVIVCEHNGYYGFNYGVTKRKY